MIEEAGDSAPIGKDGPAEAKDASKRADSVDPNAPCRWSVALLPTTRSWISPVAIAASGSPLSREARAGRCEGKGEWEGQSTPTTHLGPAGMRGWSAIGRCGNLHTEVTHREVVDIVGEQDRSVRSGRAGYQRVGSVDGPAFAREVGLVAASSARRLPVTRKRRASRNAAARLRSVGRRPRSISAMFTQVVASECPWWSLRRRSDAMGGVSRRYPMSTVESRR